MNMYLLDYWNTIMLNWTLKNGKNKYLHYFSDQKILISWGTSGKDVPGWFPHHILKSVREVIAKNFALVSSIKLLYQWKGMFVNVYRQATRSWHFVKGSLLEKKSSLWVLYLREQIWNLKGSSAPSQHHLIYFSFHILSMRTFLLTLL